MTERIKIGLLCLVVLELGVLVLAAVLLLRPKEYATINPTSNCGVNGLGVLTCDFVNMTPRPMRGICVTGKLAASKAPKKATSGPVCSGEVGAMESVRKLGQMSGDPIDEVCANPEGRLSWSWCNLTIGAL